MAKDVDAGVNGLVEYQIVKSKKGKSKEDGFGIFSINLPHQGAVVLNRTLDYEKGKKYYVTVVASVKRVYTCFQCLTYFL